MELVMRLSLIAVLAFGAPNALLASEPSGWNDLGGEAQRILEHGATERPFSGKYLNHKDQGTYTCARCKAPLFPSGSKFNSKTGWPSFDQALPGAVKELVQGDGRVEIRCARCDGHLGHLFLGEKMTEKSTRHCVKSLALGFQSQPLAEAFFAGGCFWGVEYLLEQLPGVISAESGYMGGGLASPSYQQVISGSSGHAETVRVSFDPSKLSFEDLARAFFEIHDPTQGNRQGPDVGEQYRSAVFVTDSEQERVVARLLAILRDKGLKITTSVEPAAVFWPAEAYHQDYYKRSGKTPYCHERKQRF
jgi:peptide methionine sulfoxide reductase msrA/msrB